MTYDPTATYRSTEVASSSPAARIVLLYQGAIRFAAQHVSALDRGDREAAHHASIRCQAIVAGLQETLDLSAGAHRDAARPAVRLPASVAWSKATSTKNPGPTEEALTILRMLLGTWQEIARTPAVAGSPARHPGPAAASMGPALS